MSYFTFTRALHSIFRPAHCWECAEPTARIEIKPWACLVYLSEFILNATMAPVNISDPNNDIGQRPW